MSGRGQVSDPAEFKQSLRPLALSVLIGAIICAILLFLFSVIMASQNIPQFLVNPMSIFSISAGGLAGGFCCARYMRTRGLLYGGLTGFVFCVIVLLCGLALRDNSFGVPALFKIVFIMLSSMLGGVLGVNVQKRRR